MKTNMTYSTKEQAERMGKAEAAKITRRGYPTTLLEVRPVELVVDLRIDCDVNHIDSDSPKTVKATSERLVSRRVTRWEAVLS